jgi:hypothetical protein
VNTKPSRRSVENSKSRHGGARPGAGRKRGSKWPRTIAKEQAREALRALVMEHFRPLVEGQIANAMGLRYLVVRDKVTGKFLRVGEAGSRGLKPNEEVIEVWEKEPSVPAFTDLMNRTLDKPMEQPFEVKVEEQHTLEVRLIAGRLRVAEARRRPSSAYASWTEWALYSTVACRYLSRPTVQ